MSDIAATVSVAQRILLKSIISLRVKIVTKYSLMKYSIKDKLTNPIIVPPIPKRLINLKF